MFAQRPILVQQLRQRFLHTGLPALSRQGQDPYVLPVRTLRLPRQQRVIRPPVRQRRVQVLAVHVTGERPRLAHQPVDHVAIIDAVLRLPTQAFHRLHLRTRVPHLDHLGTNARLDPLPQQARRHRVNVLLHLDRAALAHPHPLTFQRLQPTLRQRAQARLLRRELLPSPGVTPGHQGSHELPVVLPSGEVPAATQKQRLRQRLLETPMALFAIAVLVSAIGVRGLGRQTVVTHQSLIPRRVLLQVPIVVHGQCHAVGAMTLGHTAQRPQGVLQSFAQAGEALGETQRHVLPVRAGQHKVIQQVRKRLSLDGHAQAVQVREVRRA